MPEKDAEVLHVSCKTKWQCFKNLKKKKELASLEENFFSCHFDFQSCVIKHYLQRLLVQSKCVNTLKSPIEAKVWEGQVGTLRLNEF